MTSSPFPSKLESILLLDAYHQHQTAGSSKLRSCFLNLSKARRQKMNQSLSATGAELTASNVRDELCSRKALEDDKEEERRFWKLVDPVEEAEKKMYDNIDREVILENKENQDGLRQRKKKTEMSKDNWTTELLSDNDEDELLRKANPIDLFGAFPSKDLRNAQEDAGNALQYYIDAANLAVSILKAIDKKNNQ
mmetsp:Transcript_1208/g.1547  ORF Transcript_1208/g.1547 Transcript_1208/m.1547 type:complete len:194 (-) Transcript_1208:4-585(-)